MTNSYIFLLHRGVLCLSGADRKSFLQGLITNDIRRLSAQRTLYSALLTPQGRYLFDFFIFEHGDVLYLETEASQSVSLKERLNLYKLRSNVTLTDASQAFAILALLGEGIFKLFGLPPTPGAMLHSGNAIVTVDPRLPELGLRAYIPLEERDAFISTYALEALPFGAYEHLRLSCGVPKGGCDMIIDKAIPLECGLDELNAIGWEKGCYLGQELNARTKYRGMVHKRLFPVTVTGPLPENGETVVWKGEEVGVMRSSCQNDCENRGMALLRIAAVKNALASSSSFICGASSLTPSIPSWMRLDSEDSL